MMGVSMLGLDQSELPGRVRLMCLNTRKDFGHEPRRLAQKAHWANVSSEPAESPRPPANNKNTLNAAMLILSGHVSHSSYATHTQTVPSLCHCCSDVEHESKQSNVVSSSQS